MQRFGACPDIVKYLITECSQNVNTQNFPRYQSPLAVASKLGHAEVARVLLEHGADTQIEDESNWSPLIWASVHGYVEVIQVLRDYGAHY
jgi:ankyrin repeat protein